jgi:hypothetical protein
MKYVKYIGIGVAILATYFFVSSITVQASPEELRQQAYEARLKARRNDCKTIGERIKNCTTNGDKVACEAMTKSTSWFSAEYGGTWEILCTAPDDPLTLGATAQQ